MHVRERMIRARFATQMCEGCGSSYAQGTVLVLARRPAAWLVLASCGKCEHRCIYLVSFPDAGQGIGAVDSQSAELREHAHPGEVLDRAREVETHEDVPISDADVAAMHSFLAHFDGDFRRVFASGGPDAR